MDDRTWYLLVGSLALATVGVVLDWLSRAFDVPGGLWGFLSALLGFLGTRSVLKSRNGNRKEDE